MISNLRNGYFIRPNKTYTKWLKLGRVKIMISFPIPKWLQR